MSVCGAVLIVVAQLASKHCAQHLPGAAKDGGWDPQQPRGAPEGEMGCAFQIAPTNLMPRTPESLARRAHTGQSGLDPFHDTLPFELCDRR